jgi:hypothetical protein
MTVLLYEIDHQCNHCGQEKAVGVPRVQDHKYVALVCHQHGCQLLVFLEALKMILPLAESYLKSAPSHPDNAKLETARAAIIQAEKGV